MKRVFLSLFGLISVLGVVAQLPVWTIRPNFDAIEMKLDNKLIATDSAGITSIWSLDGKRLFTTHDKVMPYNENYAVVVDESNAITGILDSKGNFTELKEYTVAYSDPYFHNGYLLCSLGSALEYITPDGTQAELAPSIKSYPFRGGFAPYMIYEHPQKLKGAHYKYHSAYGDAINFMLKGKKVEDKDVQFLSGIAPNGKGVAIIDDKVYWFDTSTKDLSPMLAGPETEPEKKRHLELDSNSADILKSPIVGREIELTCKYGKKQVATLKFGDNLVPQVFSFDGEVMLFEDKPKDVVEYKSAISSFGDEKKGLKYNEAVALPEQFDAIGITYDDRVMVKINGKWGLLNIDPSLQLRLTMNKGEDIPFRHHKYGTQVRLDIPTAISSKELRINIPDTTGCDLDRTSRTAKDTEYGNFVQYDCTLTIPANLPDSITTIVYAPVKISYDGLNLPDRPLAVKAWHLKYYNVDPIDSETSVKDGIATFTVNIDAQRNVGDSDYPFDVKIIADSVQVQYEKLSETRYKCIVSNLQAGINHMTVVITEKECPSSFFPFEISYAKPEKRTAESVSIRKISVIDNTEQLNKNLPSIVTPLPADTLQVTDTVPAQQVTDSIATPQIIEPAVIPQMPDSVVPQPLNPLTKMVLGID